MKAPNPEANVPIVASVCEELLRRLGDIVRHAELNRIDLLMIAHNLHRQIVEEIAHDMADDDAIHVLEGAAVTFRHAMDRAIVRWAEEKPMRQQRAQAANAEQN